MPKTGRFFVLVTAVGLLVSAGYAHADLQRVSSKIIEVNTTSNYLKLYKLDTQTEKTEEIRVSVPDSARFLNVESHRDLKIDDEVSVAANYEAFSHEWTAIEITLLAPAPAA